jgi:uncharacterized protein (TIGR00369 family)
MNGLELLRAILTGAHPKAPIQKTLGFDLVAADDGMARFRLVPGEQHYNPMGSVHGGVACTLLDSAMGAAVHSTLGDRHAYATTDVHVHLTRAITAKTGPIVAEGRVVHRGSRLLTAEGRLTDEQGKLLAHATATCLVLER